MRKFQAGVIPLFMVGVFSGCGGSDLTATAKALPATPPVPANSDQMKTQIQDMSKTIKAKASAPRKPGAPLAPPRPPGT
ncbi:MAG: hypothetical protein P4L84_37425 [Isosphaeraceae bacterium]|nr:hypothetical protein [Isosphaeraceae bacterium]